MDFKRTALVFSLLSSACAKDRSPIALFAGMGIPLEPIAVSESATGDIKSVVLFDETVRQIHRFDLNKMSVVRTSPVKNSNLDHTVLSHPDGNYIVDMTSKHLSIFNQNGIALDNPIQFQGKPVSAAFRPNQGLLVVQDDLMSIGILEMSAQGQVTKSWVGGPIVEGNTSIWSGDLNENGQLFLSLSDKSIAIVDVDQSVTNGSWNFTSFATALEETKWVAPVPGTPAQIFVKTKDSLALVDTGTQAVIATLPTPISTTVLKLSKHGYPHAILAIAGQTLIAYPEAGQIRTKDLFNNESNFLFSKLDLVNDTWTVVSFSYSWYGCYGGYCPMSSALSVAPNPYISTNDYRYNRILRKYRFSDLLALQNKSIRDKAQVQLSNSFVFALFPSKLGYAVRYNVNDEGAAELVNFNLGIIH